MNVDTATSSLFLPSSITPGRGELILLAEDQHLMQMVTQRLLGRIGYRVLLAGSVEEALLLWLEHEEEVELVVTDYTFESVLTGMDLILKLHDRAPELPALIVSGSWEPDPRKEPPLPPHVAYLAKPYEIAGLSAAIRRLLNERHPRLKAKLHPAGHSA